MLREKNELINFVKLSTENEFILVTVTDTEGSTYRKKGAHKVISLDGKSAGLISGGCLEGEIIQHALEMKSNQSSYMIDTSSDLDRLFGYSIGCQGKVKLKFERLNRDEIQTDSYLGIRKDEELRVCVFGAGPDIEPLFQLLKWSNWDVTYFTHQNEFYNLRKNQEWNIEKVDPHNLAIEIHNPGRTAVLLMSHNYPSDIEVLKYMMTQSVEYIGVLGPRKKKEQMLLDLDRLYNFKVPDKFKSKIHGPMGLNGFGRGESAIALSIVSELQSCFFGKQQ